MYKLVMLFVVLQVTFICFIASPAHCARILVVTTEQSVPAPIKPELHEWQSGQYVITDLVCAGLPFDLVTYNKFVGLDLSPYDVIILNGHTTPIPVSQVAAKCLTAVQSGRKVFINGHWPYQRYDSKGKLVEQQTYATSLFPVDSAGTMSVTGPAVAPLLIEKDSAVTAAGNYSQSVNLFTCREIPPLKITLSNKVVGFVYPQGGAVDGKSEYTLSILDYGKLAHYLRHGDTPLFGFANDRAEGMPIASFEVHCDNTSHAISNVNLGLTANQYQVPLYNLLVYSGISPSVAANWNAISSSPMIRIGSHSRTHPYDWSALPDLAYETTGALAAQRLLIPSTGTYFNFSGHMNPTSQQLDELTASGLLFGGGGSGWRKSPVSSYGSMPVQPMPTTPAWFTNLAKCNSTPYSLAHTMESDYIVYMGNLDYVSALTASYAANRKYGMYNFGYIHDYMFNPAWGYRTTSGLMYDQIRAAFAYLKSQGAKFVFSDDLIRRLRDYLAGDITCVDNPDGSITINVHRPSHLVNEIKVGFKGDLTPVAVAGPSVLGQRLDGEWLYVTLPAEVDSSVQVQWSLLPPAAPTVTSPPPYISHQGVVTWTQNTHPQNIAEYQYAVGVTPEGTDTLNWTSSGTATVGSLSGANLQNGGHYYLSVRARYAGSSWSAVGSAGPYIADSTPPSIPVVTDVGSSQESNTDLSAGWSSSDPETEVVEYMYAIGASPGDNGVRDWTSATDTGMAANALDMQYGGTYYVSVKAKNGMGLWSSVGVSDGITIAVPTTHPSIGVAKTYADNVQVVLQGNGVTAKFEGGFYIEAPDRSSGIRVKSDQVVELDQEVTIEGYIGCDCLERQIENISPVVATGTKHIKPLYLENMSLGGKSSSLVFGPTGGSGLNNVGLLVKTFGKITNVGSTYIDIDDGSAIPGVAGQTGVRVILSAPHSFLQNSQVFVTGISALTADGACLRRTVRTRSNSDVVVVH